MYGGGSFRINKGSKIENNNDKDKVIKSINSMAVRCVSNKKKPLPSFFVP